MSQKVELHLAFVWDCDSCGRENFVRSISRSLTPEDEAEVESRYGSEALESMQGSYAVCPDEVTCHYCKRSFRTEQAA